MELPYGGIGHDIHQCLLNTMSLNTSWTASGFSWQKRFQGARHSSSGRKCFPQRPHINFEFVALVSPSSAFQVPLPRCWCPVGSTGPFAVISRYFIRNDDFRDIYSFWWIPRKSGHNIKKLNCIIFVECRVSVLHKCCGGWYWPKLKDSAKYHSPTNVSKSRIHYLNNSQGIFMISVDISGSND